MNKQKWLFLFFWTMITSWVHAQPNLAFYPLNNQFNSSEYNPAFLTSREKFTFSIFPLAGTSISLNNLQIVRDLAPKILSGDVTDDDYEKNLDRIIEHPTAYQSAESSLLSFTYRSKKGILNFRIKERQYALASLEGELMDFIFKTSVPSVAISKIQRLPIQGGHFREYSLGYSFTSRDNRLSAGVRAKLYYGKSFFSSDLQASVENLPSGEYGLNASGRAYISVPGSIIKHIENRPDDIDLSKLNIKNYIWNSGNPGVGIDLGINYQVNPELSLSASVMDLGQITWKNNLESKQMNETYLLDNVAFDPESGLITKADARSYRRILDLQDIPRDSSSFSTALPMYVYAGIKYQVDPVLSLGITNRFAIIKYLNYNSFSITANFNVNKKLSLSTGYSMIGDSRFNIPMALLHEGNFGQVYLGTDNLSSILFPSQAEFAAIGFGACFYLFTHRNLLLKRSELTPFYQPRKTIKNRGSGLIIKARKKDQ